jgi:redox-sensitive bicupin YhaK (pirin superfamily)
MQPRKVIKIAQARAASDGAGVKIQRLSGFGSYLNMDPFLMLDEIRSQDKDDYIAGFPPHPHRGFETVTYMRVGGFSHKDSMGNEGTINAGGAQWMTAASGVIHSEMPSVDDSPGEDDNPGMHGFQFWLNLPAAEKMGQPGYRDIQGKEVTSFQQDGALIRLIAGEMGAAESVVTGPVTGKTTQALLADVMLSAGGSATLRYSKDLSSQFYVYQGSGRIGDKTLSRGELAQLGQGDSLQLIAEQDSGLLLFGGLPLREPVVHYGPFVMNSQQEIDQAIRDYQAGTLVRRQ